MAKERKRKQVVAQVRKDYYDPFKQPLFKERVKTLNNLLTKREQ